MSNDKNNLLALGYIGALVGITLFIMTLADNVTNALIPLIVILFIQQVYIIPQFVEKYYAINGQDIGFKKYIPFLGEYSTMTVMLERINIVATTIAIISAILIVAPIPMSDYNKAVEFKNFTVYLFIVTYIAHLTCRGIGYSSVFRDIERIYYEYSEIENRSSININLLCYISIFFPVVRSIALMFQLSVLNNIIDMADYEE